MIPATETSILARLAAQVAVGSLLLGTFDTVNALVATLNAGHATNMAKLL